jgi:transposase
MPLRLARNYPKGRAHRMGQGRRNSQRKKLGKNSKVKVVELPEELSQVNLNAAGIDVGSQMHMVAVPVGRDEVSVRKFEAFTTDLEALADWLESCGVMSVVMESTGVYWIPLYEMLEASGFEVKLVDARQVKNVSGRKSDVLDCQWLQQLHTYGLLAGAFRPPDKICTLRGYMRQKEMLVQASSMNIQHMQKALVQLNLLLHNVISDITSKTGMKIIKEILAGERDPKVLAKNRDKRCNNSEEVIAKSLVGSYRDEHLFALKQAVELYEFHQLKIEECEQAIAKCLGEMEIVTDEEPPSSQKKVKPKEYVRGEMNVRNQLFKMAGVDLFAIPGLGADTLLTMAAEVGFDMSPWPSVKHFTSWLGLCPGTYISGGKLLSNKTKRTRNRAKQALRIAAAAIGKTQTALGAFYRQIRSRSGGIQAITATAHKIARIYYSMLKSKTAFAELGQQGYEEKYRDRRLKGLTKQARSLGYELVPAA